MHHIERKRVQFIHQLGTSLFVPLATPAHAYCMGRVSIVVEDLTHPLV